MRPGDIIVLRGEGPKGSGMPKSGRIVVPDKLLNQGITDMLRITARVSVARSSRPPCCTWRLKSAAGGPLGLVLTGDMISLDVPNRSLHLEVSDETLAERAKYRVEFPRRNIPERGFAKLVADSVMQANKRCDLEFLAGPTRSARQKEQTG